MNIFIELSLILAITTLLSWLLHTLRQPLVVGYIIAGIAVGPYGLGLISTTHELELFSKFGIVILLFIVGLNLNPTVIKEVGKISLITGVGQVLFTSAIGFFLSLMFGLDRIAALYVAIALTFSSTIIILKLLTDRGDVYSLYGKIAIGFLLVQDVIATIILFSVSAFANDATGNLWLNLLLIVLKSAGLGIVLWLASKHLLFRAAAHLAKTGELFFLFTLSWALGIAAAFYLLGFSVEIGALIAGVTLSMTPFAYDVASRLKPLRDFFITLFFVLLGSQMILSDIGSILLPAIVLSIFVLIGNPIIVIVLMNILGYTKKTSFMAGLTVAQISEFSLILAALGLQVGHLDQEVVSLITLIGLITIMGSTYLILYADKLFPVIEPWLKYLQLNKNPHDQRSANSKPTAILFGYQRVGRNFMQTLERLRASCLIVDHDPQAVSRISADQFSYRFGDASSSDFLEELPLKTVRIVISSLADFDTQLLITQTTHRANHRAIIIVLANTASEALVLYQAGATYVMLPHYLGAFYTNHLIGKHAFNRTAYRKLQDQHIRQLNRLVKESDIIPHLIG